MKTVLLNKTNYIIGILGALLFFGTVFSIFLYNSTMFISTEPIPENEEVNYNDNFVAVAPSFINSDEATETVSNEQNSSATPKNGNASSNTTMLYSISIPSANIKAQVNAMGINSAGAMDVTKDPKKATWFKLGPKPGKTGSAVIAGHSGYRGGIASFETLPKVNKGDIVTLTNLKTNEILTFKVIKKKKYKADSTVNEVFDNKSGKYLNLITCVGRWDSSRGTHSERLVVFTELIE